jgi:hypothetical protein
MPSDLLEYSHRVAGRGGSRPGRGRHPMEVPSVADAIPLPFEPEETWRPVIGYEGLYEVSDHGRVRRVAIGKGSRPGKILHYGMSKGYRSVALYRERQRRFYVHRLVAEAFIGSRPAGYECNHKNGDKLDNRPANLEWLTQAENLQHAIRNGLVARKYFGEEHPQAKITAADAAEIRRLRGVLSQKVIAARFGITDSRVGQIQRGQGWNDS